MKFNTLVKEGYRDLLVTLIREMLGTMRPEDGVANGNQFQPHIELIDGGIEVKELSKLEATLVKTFFESPHYHEAKIPTLTLKEDATTVSINIDDEQSARILQLIRTNPRMAGKLWKTKINNANLTEEEKNQLSEVVYKCLPETQQQIMASFLAAREHTNNSFPMRS